MVGWTPAHLDHIRPHLSYMTVDMPAAWRERLGVDDGLVARLRATLASDGPAAAGRLVPDSVLGAFAITGDRASVIRRLATTVGEAAPELVAFGPHEYTTEHLRDIAALAAEAGLSTSAGRLTL